MSQQQIILTAEQMRVAEQRAMQQGISGWKMMQQAGRAVVEHIIATYEEQPVLVLCGPGNNGGDGFVVAEELRRSGWPVRVAWMLAKTGMRGDAATAMNEYGGESVALADDMPVPERLVVDALFGTGLLRPLDEKLQTLFQRIKQQGAKVVAVDIPSGIHTDTGKIMGAALAADSCVTFAAPKRAHALLPGKLYSGQLVVADIGISRALSPYIAELPQPQLTYENAPLHWQHLLPKDTPGQHKYSKGAVLVRGGPLEMTGASRLAAMGAQRSGAGASTICVDKKLLPVYAAQLTSIIINLHLWAEAVVDARYSALVVGPGNGVDKKTSEAVMQALKSEKPVVLDAD